MKCKAARFKRFEKRDVRASQPKRILPEERCNARRILAAPGGRVLPRKRSRLPIPVHYPGIARSSRITTLVAIPHTTASGGVADRARCDGCEDAVDDHR